MDGGAWWAAVHGVTKGRTWLSDFTFTFHFHALEKEMATHSSVLAWRIPGTGEPGGLPSVGSYRVRHDWSDLAAAAAEDENIDPPSPEALIARFIYFWLQIDRIDGETMQTVRDFIFGGSKITADGDCSHEIKRCLLLRRKAMTNLDSILKSRDITLPTKVHLVKAMVFPVVMYRFESWTIKRAEHQRIDAFELWCCRRLLRVPWTARRSNQSILKEISPGKSDWCWSWNSNTLATWCEELTHWKIPWCLERLKVGGERVERGWNGWMEFPTQWTWVWVNSGSW